ncbi:hypothetical protein DFH06DRAFT_1442141, partial [Mycena polygramma]
SFLLAADSISGAEAVSIAKLLNADIFQTATFIADSLECTPAKSNTAAQTYLGESITKVLQSADAGVVQIALQTAIARRCKGIIDSWCLGDEWFGNSLCALYEKILLAENRIAAHRWRAMTRAQTRCSEDNLLVTSSLVQCIFDVMVAAGWIFQEEYIEDKFAGHIAAIAKYSLQLRKAIGEDIVSEDLEVVYVGPNQIFREQTMEDVYAVGRRKDQSRRAARAGFDVEVVACTSDIGLQKRGRNTLDFKGGDILLRPKVVLQSAFV